ncbi:MAG: ATP-binding cassette domain-containing protein [SAR202 cluster bacterium]|nr:ATP-binding cassette domain-containing protein [SAR202 cluster bacterium]
MQSPPADGKAISVEGLGKRFGKVVALDGISFEVAAGAVLGLLGPNGAGKTTTVRILTTILRPDQGRATVLGIDVARNSQAVRERIGLAGQYAAVDENLTGRENLRLIGRLTHQSGSVVKKRAGELIERFGLAAAADRVARTYSGGMRRRLDLAAALIHKPPVLFLDEPTTGLDPASRSELWEVIAELVADGTTLLVTTHYLEEADRLANRIIVIDGGKIIAEGTAAELKSRIGGVVVEVALADQAQAARASAALGAVGTCSLTPGGKTVEIKVSDGTRTLVNVVRILDQERLEPISLAMRESTLDDVFLTLTGHKAASNKAEPAPGGRRRSRWGEG